MNKYLLPIICVIAVIAVIISSHTKTVSVGSVSQGGAYQYVTFAPVQVNANIKQSTIIASTTLNGPVGTLGSVIITGANTGTFTVYDATTSNGLVRTIAATSSLPVLATFPASTAAGTYTYDSIYRFGLIVEFSGNVSTSTITWRPY